MLVEQPGASLVRVEVMLDETVLIVKMPGPSSNICLQDLRGMFFKEVHFDGSKNTGV